MHDTMLAETVALIGHDGDGIEAYSARPLDERPHGGVVIIRYMPGYDAPTKEIVRRFAVQGYNAICPNLYYREAPGASPDDAAATNQSAGGVPDDRLVGDVDAAATWLRGLTSANGKIGTIGYCSGGRQSFLVACRLPIDAAIVCYGAFIVGEPPSALGVRMQPIIDLAGEISCPILGLFGAEDEHPSREEVVEISMRLGALGKVHDFHTYNGAGHAFFSVDRPSYRVEASNDGWRRIWDFYSRFLDT